MLGNGILPLQQQLIDIQAQVAASHCPLLGYSCRAYLTSSSAAAPYTFQELLQLKRDFSALILRSLSQSPVPLASSSWHLSSSSCPCAPWLIIYTQSASLYAFCICAKASLHKLLSPTKYACFVYNSLHNVVKSNKPKKVSDVDTVHESLSLAVDPSSRPLDSNTPPS